MGTVFNKFGSNKYNNETEVNQNFIVPLLTELLGYSLNEIIPEHYFPVFDAQVSRDRRIKSSEFPIKQKPDFVVCIENSENPKFVVESKAPNEDLTKHEPQARAYAIGVKVNIIVLTNGAKFRIYYVNDLIFEAKSIEELDINFESLKNILSREIHKSCSSLEIVRAIDPKSSLGKTAAQEIDDEVSRKRLKISDFKHYLENICDEFKNWQVPREFELGDDFDFQQYPPDRLLKFQDSDPNDNSSLNIKERIIYLLPDIEEKVKSKNITFIGYSGIGKTTLLKYLAWFKSNEALQYKQILIPVYIQLRNYASNNSIESLILHSFAERGLYISETQFYDYLKENEFIFLFDAYDEVQEKYVEDLQREMVQFISICNRRDHRIIITSRNIRIPHFLHSSIFYVCPLEESQIQELSKQYFYEDWYEFYYEIQKKGLRIESQNTLLLTFLIFIYKKYSFVPTSKTNIIKEVVANIKEWEKIKGKRFNFNLPWKIKTKLMSELAFASAINNESLSLTKTETDEVIFPLIEFYENIREISGRIERQELINNLISTAIICKNMDGISFWHTAFLEYFASISLAEKYIENPAVIEKIKAKVWWKSIIIGAAGFLQDSTTYVENILETNLYLASSCLLESKNIDDKLVNKIASRLASNCESSLSVIRQRSIYYLEKIEDKYPSELLFEILNKNPYSDVKQIALEQIAISKSDRAKEIVYRFIDWNENRTSLDQKTTQESVTKALSYFGEQEHLKIIGILKKQPGLSASIECREALLNVIRRNELTDKVKETLFDFFLEPSQIHSAFHKSYLAKVIVEINDVKFVPTLIEYLKNKTIESEDYGFLRGITEILASFTSNEVIEQLITYAFDTNQKIILRQCCAGALSISRGKVEFSIFEHLVEDEDILVRRRAIDGFRRYPSSQVKEILFTHIKDKNDWIQRDIIEVLGEKGLLIELINNNLFPIEYYEPISEYLKQISKYHLVELLHTLDKLSHIIKDKNLQMQIAETYCSISKKDEAKRIIENFYEDENFTTDDLILYNVIKIAPNFDFPYSIELIHRALKSIKNINKEKSISYEYSCIQALGKISSDDSVKLLKELAENFVYDNFTYEERDFFIEIIFRSLNSLVSTKEEDWYINFLKLNPHLHGWGLHRIIDGLGGIGTEKSIEIIREIAESHKDNSDTLNICFISYDNIMFSSGKIVNVQEENYFNNLSRN